MTFTYFQGPTVDMADYCADEQECALCGTCGPGFALDFALCPTVPAEARAGRYGCPTCLRAGHFTFWHNTELGMLDEHGLTADPAQHPAPTVELPAPALQELLRTPQISTWQQEVWLTHCHDFMAYVGTWEPADFYRHAPDGDGRALFLAMTTEGTSLWDDSLPEGEAVLVDWVATYYVFQCRHCGQLRGNWDSD